MIRLTGATLLTPEQEFPQGILCIEGERIVYAGSVLGAPPAAPGDETVDLPGRAIIPGFVNAHTHLAMQLLRGIADDVPLQPWLTEHIWPVEDRIGEDDVLIGTRLALLEAVASGVTAVNDMYMAMDRVAEAIGEAGIRGVITQGLVGHADQERRKLRTGIDLFERWQGQLGGRIQVALGPHAPYTCSPSYLKEVAQAAKALDARIHIHLAETHQETRDLAAEGRTPAHVLLDSRLSEQPVIAAHYVAPAESDFALLEGMRIGIAHCPISNLKLGCGFAPVARYRAHGIPVGLGSDGAASANVLDPFLSMKSAAWIAKGASQDPTQLPARTVLRMATYEGALALGLGDVGLLAEGFKADVVVVDLRSPAMQPVFDVASALVYTATARDVERVYGSGRLLYAEGRHLLVDREQIVREARHTAERIAQRAIYS
ncbi:MAG: amidohydrolase [Thermaerobacter sp.]|nr:amidohydrolase [Thermaerobacter sp.]